MDPAELRSILKHLRVTQADLARLVGVTNRAVNMWVMNDRRVPGPVAAYLRLLMKVPVKTLAEELHRLRSDLR